MHSFGSFVPFLVFGQALGAVIGVGATLWGEAAYLRAMRDGNIDRGERNHLRMIAHGLRFGLTLLLLASFALVLEAYFSHAAMQPALTASYWMLIVLSLLLIYSGWALSRKHISFGLGSALVFTAWWFTLYLTFGQLPLFTFAAAVVFFVVATAIFYGILRYARILAGERS